MAVVILISLESESKYFSYLSCYIIKDLGDKLENYRLPSI